MKTTSSLLLLAIAACGPASNTNNNTCPDTQALCGETCTEKRLITFSGHVVDTFAGNPVTNANGMGVQLLGASTDGIVPVTGATAPVMADGSFTMETDLTCETFVNTAMAVGQMGTPAVIIPSSGLVQLGRPTANLTNLKIFALTVADAAKMNMSLGRSGATAVETAGAAIVVAMRANGARVAGATATTQASNGVIEYPSATGASGGTGTDASGIITFTGAYATMAGPAFITVRAPGGEPITGAAPIVPQNVLFTPMVLP